MLGEPHHKGRAARVERFAKTVRNQALTLVNVVESTIDHAIPVEHALASWAVMRSMRLLVTD